MERASMAHLTFVSAVLLRPCRPDNLLQQTCTTRHPMYVSMSTVDTSSNIDRNRMPRADVKFIWLENNSFMLEFASNRLLVDPWLTDDLVFGTPKFFKQTKAIVQTASWADFQISTVDAIVLTQGLPDHAHPPTLAKLPKHLPIIAPKSAIPLLKSLSFSNIVEITYGETVRPIAGVPDITLTASRGSIVGPPWSDAQLGYVFSFWNEDQAEDGGASRPLTVYHEPHGNHDFELLEDYTGSLDAVIAPIIATTIPALGNYALVNGVPEAIALCRATQPTACMPFDNSKGDQSGFLKKYLKVSGGRETFARAIAREPSLNNMKVIEAPEALQSVIIASTFPEDIGL